MPQKEKEERQRDGDEHLAVERPGLAEQREGPAVPRGERDGGNRRRQHRGSQPHRAEEREPRLVDDRERDRSDRARLMQHHLRRTDSADLCDEREESMPERKGIAGVEAAVRELVHRTDVQVAER